MAVMNRRDAQVLDADRHRMTAIGKSLGLTPGQSAIAACVHAGLADKEIAAKTGTKATTIGGHLTAIFYRLQTKNRARVAVLWERASSAYALRRKHYSWDARENDRLPACLSTRTRSPATPI